jgi:uncharacterized repeat protein (TIGR03803 family)
MYGTTSYGTLAYGNTGGTVFEVTPAGQERVLYSFTTYGENPQPGLVRDSAGNIYGVTYGGSGTCGVAFKLSAAGQQGNLHTFGEGTDGCHPAGGVIRDSVGNLYGATTYGGSFGYGLVFKLNTNGEETVLYNFTGKDDGGNPNAGLIRDSAGNLYGTACPFTGIVYKVDSSGTETVLHSFAWPDGGCPTGLIRDAEGNLYGTISNGGTTFLGEVFKLDTSGHETVLYSFPGGASGQAPNGIIPDSAGNIYGTTEYGGTVGLGVVYRLDNAGQETVLYSFPSAPGGLNPNGIVSDSAGNLYGATTYGGTANAGVVYKLDPAGHETVLHNFSGGADGGWPAAGVILDSVGNLYGTAGGGEGAGVVYRLDTAGQETVLYSFTGGADGGGPTAGVIRDAEGNLYGTASGGGQFGAGVVYKVDTAGQETVLYSFRNSGDGGDPQTAVIRDAKGNLYGTTSFGGNFYADAGVAYRVDTAGRQTVLWRFSGISYPGAHLAFDKSGNLYGTMTQGGPWNAGAIYEVDGIGNERVLYKFTGYDDGGGPQSGLILDSTGNLYGTAQYGGAFGWGVVYKLDPTTGELTVLYSFDGTDGGTPLADLVHDPGGNLYGTTWFGGIASSGTVFKLSPF